MAQISLHVDDATKMLAEQTCNDLGISMSAAIIIFLKKMGRERRIPFEVSIDPFYTDENMARLRESIAQMETTDSTIQWRYNKNRSMRFTLPGQVKQKSPLLWRQPEQRA